MRCRQVQDRLLPYLAGELPPAETERVLRHLTHCHACFSHAAELSETEQELQAGLSGEIHVPDRLEGRVLEAVRHLEAPRRTWRLPRREFFRSPWRAAVLGACAVAVTFWLGHWSAKWPDTRAKTPGGVQLATLREAHQRLSRAETGEMRNTDPERLSSALTSRVRFPVRPVDLQPEATRLVGGSELRIAGAPVACLHYQWRGARVSLFQMDAGRLSPAGLRQMPSTGEDYVAERTDGVSCVAWRSGSVNCVLVSREMPMHRLFQMACHACERQERLRRAPLPG